MTTDNRNEDPDRAMEAFIKPIEIPEPIEPQTLSARLRAAADDLQFQGRPDPHDDKALLREAATNIDDLSKFAAHLWLLLHEIEGLDPTDTIMSKVEFRGKVRELAGKRGAAPASIGKVISLEAAAELGRYLMTEFVAGKVDTTSATFLPAPGEDAKEGPAGVAMGLLKLAMSRGAFAPGEHIQTEHGPVLLMQGEPRIYFARTPDGIDEYTTPEQAKAAAEDALEYQGDGWPEGTEATCWGVMVPIEHATEFDRRETPGEEFDYTVSYKLVQAGAQGSFYRDLQDRGADMGPVAMDILVDENGAVASDGPPMLGDLVKDRLGHLIGAKNGPEARAALRKELESFLLTLKGPPPAASVELTSTDDDHAAGRMAFRVIVRKP